jgi:predicted RNA-binding protein
MGSYEGYYKGDASISENEMVNNQEGSKVQKNGSVSVLVENIDESIEALKSINNTFGGQITNIYDNGKGNERTVQITVKVPVEKFEAYYEQLRKLDGEVVYADITTVDVTEEYIDITSRLNNLRNTEAQLNKILERADSVTDVLAVQKELSTVRGEIESYEQRKRYFDSKTDYAYISVSFAIDKTGLNISEEQWKPWGEVKAAVKALIEVLKDLVNVIIWLVIFSPLVLIPYFLIKHFKKGKKTEETGKMV